MEDVFDFLRTPSISKQKSKTNLQIYGENAQAYVEEHKPLQKTMEYFTNEKENFPFPESKSTYQSRKGSKGSVKRKTPSQENEESIDDNIKLIKECKPDSVFATFLDVVKTLPNAIFIGAETPNDSYNLKHIKKYTNNEIISQCSLFEKPREENSSYNIYDKDNRDNIKEEFINRDNSNMEKVYQLLNGTHIIHLYPLCESDSVNIRALSDISNNLIYPDARISATEAFKIAQDRSESIRGIQNRNNIVFSINTVNDEVSLYFIALLEVLFDTKNIKINNFLLEFINAAQNSAVSHYNNNQKNWDNKINENSDLYILLLLQTSIYIYSIFIKTLKTVLDIYTTKLIPGKNKLLFIDMRNIVSFFQSCIYQNEIQHTTFNNQLKNYLAIFNSYSSTKIDTTIHNDVNIFDNTISKISKNLISEKLIIKSILNLIENNLGDSTEISTYPIFVSKKHPLNTNLSGIKFAKKNDIPYFSCLWTSQTVKHIPGNETDDYTLLLTLIISMIYNNIKKKYI